MIITENPEQLLGVFCCVWNNWVVIKSVKVYELARLFRYMIKVSLFKAHNPKLSMKKLIILTILLSCFQVETQAENIISVKETTVSVASTESKTLTKRRRKKGFLWGLFKKNDCGCPKH